MKGQATKAQVEAYYQEAPELCNKAYVEFMIAAKIVQEAEEKASKTSVSISYGLKDIRAREIIDSAHEACLNHKSFSNPVCQCATKAIVERTNTSRLPGRMPRDYWPFANRCNAITN
jgi:hypothetical protein